MNKCMFSGNVASKPEIHVSKDGQNKVARFSLAVTDPYLNKDGQQNVSFINCVCFSKTRVEVLEKHVEAGDALILTCSFRTTEYVDKNGVKQYSYEFVVSEIEFNETKAAKEARRSRKAQQAPQQQVPGYTHQNGYQQQPQQAPQYGSYNQPQGGYQQPQQQTPQYGAPAYGQGYQQPQQNNQVQQPSAPIIPGAGMMGMNIPDDELPFN